MENTLISAEDVKFHTPDTADYKWGETNFFYFYIPEIHLIGGIQTLNRKGLGTCFVDININDNLSIDCMDHLYVDGQQHLPATEKLEESKFANGLSITAVNPPRDYEIHYAPDHDLIIDLHFRGLMDPYDINDAKEDGSTKHLSLVPEPFSKGHFDLTGHVTGTFSHRGKSFDVNCVATMDHSWGPRSQKGMGITGAAWTDANFGMDYTVHINTLLDATKPFKERYTFVSGYVREGEDIFSISEAAFEATRLPHSENLIAALTLKARDVRGKEHTLHGAVLALCKPHQFPTFQIHHTLIRWVSEKGELGYGTNMEGQMLNENIKRNQLLIG